MPNARGRRANRVVHLYTTVWLDVSQDKILQDFTLINQGGKVLSDGKEEFVNIIG